ncbi:hypothetical protein NM688_g6497 [Phlebia brevispora]|uniref:Uncharacterized protein n=1 Tax=Phlebia brevispora TaxID=194682 RepID=A0ACC1SFH9_9APHY|nr:hypothetical protein NM688_g6497 [Phlebia brevispora]
MFFTLPEVAGKYPVGTTSFAVPITNVEEADRVIGSATLRASSGTQAGTPALKLEEVAFTAFYPADISSRYRGPRTTSWIPKPVDGLLRGYTHFAGLTFVHKLLIYFLGTLARIFRFSAYRNARLLDPKHRSDASGQPWPLVIFSHGLAGTRTSYTYLCSRLASQGKVVLALEHRDGTGPFVLTRSPVPGVGGKDGSEHILYLNPDDIEVDAKHGKDQFAFRIEQLYFRRLETYLAYTAFKQLVSSKCDTTLDRPDTQQLHAIDDGPWNFKLGSREEDRLFWQSWEVNNGRARVECEKDICLAGHSFGAATLLTLLTHPPPLLGTQKFPQLPVTHVIALDPWLEPLPSPGPAPLRVESSFSSQPRLPPELLVINSETFTLWKEHFPKLEDIVNIWNNSAEDQSNKQRAHLLTIVRCKHISFSDFGIFFHWGRAGREGRKYLQTISDLSLAFVDGYFDSALRNESIASGKIETYGKKGRRRLVGNAGDVVVHT